MATIVSKRGRPEPQPEPEKVVIPTDYSPRIIIDSNGNWTFPEAVDANDEEVFRRTTEGVVDINYIPMEDC